MNAMSQGGKKHKAQIATGTPVTEEAGIVWVNFRMPREVRKGVRMIAADREAAFSDVCILALREFIERNPVSKG